MRKDLKKNKKGFTLVEIIVVLLIIGILLAITIPSIMGYVSQARDAQFEAEGRAGYVAAQTIAAREKASGSNQTTIQSKINVTTIAKELGEAEVPSTGTVPADNSIQVASCEVNATTLNISKCTFETKSSVGKKEVVFENGKDVVVNPKK